MIAYILNQVLRLQLRAFHIVSGRRTGHLDMHTFRALILIALLYKALFFYANTLPPVRVLIRKKKWRAWLAFMFLAGLLVGGAEWLLIYGIIPDNLLFPLFALPDLLGFVLTFGISLAYFLLLEWNRTERLTQVTAAGQAHTERDFLKARINPHFFLGTLNNLYSMAQAGDAEELEEGILQLAEMMRYIIYECRAERVPLLKELDYIRSYAGVSLARFRKDGHISVEIEASESELQHFLIAPVILIPFVENAFKYGVSLEKTSAIHIGLSAAQDRLTFSVAHTDHCRWESEPGRQGVGIVNIRRRLEMLYPDRYVLQERQENGYYFIQLQLTGL
jgi:hypothetical protein